MKTWKRLICWAVCLIMVGALAVSVAPLEANAAGSNKVVICAEMDANADIINLSPGIPVSTKSGMVMYTAGGLHSSSGKIWAAAIGDSAVEMKYVGTGCALDMFTFSGSSSDCYTAGQAVVGSTVTLYGINGDRKPVTGSAEITGYDPKPNSENFYELTIKIKSDTKFAPPVAMVDGDGKLVAVISSDGFFAFVEPKAKSGGETPTQAPDPTEAAPAPTEAAPAPTEAAPAPTEAEPAPTEGTEAAGAETGPSRGVDPTEEPEPEPKPGSNTALIIGIAAAVVVAVVVILLLVKKNKNNGARKVSDVDLPDTMPAPEAKVDNSKWEEVSRPSGISIYVAGVDGALRGLEYRISERGVLIGRAEDANVRYPADTKGVSRKHCKIFWNNGVLMVMDLGSTSGTFLRGKGQLPPNAPVAVVEGDVIYLGSKQNAMVIRTK